MGLNGLHIKNFNPVGNDKTMEPIHFLDLAVDYVIPATDCQAADPVVLVPVDSRDRQICNLMPPDVEAYASPRQQCVFAQHICVKSEGDGHGWPNPLNENGVDNRIME